MTSRWWPWRAQRHSPRDEPGSWRPDWTAVVARHLPGWRTLEPDEQARLVSMAEELIGRFRWEPARGFRLDDTMRVVIAATAALPVLELGLDWYRDVTSVIVHPSSIRLTGVRPGPVPGTVTEGVEHLDGEAHHHGPVVLAWDAVLSDARHPARGENVVLHEFAHRLDMVDGLTDGTPPLDDEALLARWVAVCTREFDQVRSGSPDPVLRPYAGENVGEFFAVATEVFFCRPRELRAAKAELYEVLAAFFGQDPAARADRVWGPLAG